MSNELTLERVRQFVSAPSWFVGSYGVAAEPTDSAGNVPASVDGSSEIPHDVWRALQSQFLAGSESRRGSVMVGAIFDGVAPWDTKEMLRRTRADHPPYAAQVHQHPGAFNFDGRDTVSARMRSHGSIQECDNGGYRPRVLAFMDHLELNEKWPRAVDWRAPEINPDALPEVTC